MTSSEENLQIELKSIYQNYYDLKKQQKLLSNDNIEQNYGIDDEKSRTNIMDIGDIEDLKINEKISEKACILMYLGGVFTVTISAFFIKKISIYFPDNYSANNLMVVRSTIVEIICVSVITYNKMTIPSLNQIQQKGWFFIRCTFSYFNFFFFMVGLQYLRFATMICFTTFVPVFIIILSPVFLGEKFKLRYLIGVIICLIGAMLIIFNDKKQILINEEKVDNIDTYQNNIQNTDKKASINELFQLGIGIMLGLSHTFANTFVWIASKKMVNDKMETNIQIFFTSINNFFMGTLFVILFDDFRKLLNFWYFICCCFSGIFNYIGVLLITHSLTNVDLIKITSLSYFRNVISFIIGPVFLGEIVGITDVIGSLMILGYNLYNVAVQDK